MAHKDQLSSKKDRCDICGTALEADAVIQDFPDGSVVKLCADCATAAAPEEELEIDDDLDLDDATEEWSGPDAGHHATEPPPRFRPEVFDPEEYQPDLSATTDAAARADADPEDYEDEGDVAARAAAELAAWASAPVHDDDTHEEEIALPEDFDEKAAEEAALELVAAIAEADMAEEGDDEVYDTGEADRFLASAEAEDAAAAEATGAGAAEAASAEVEPGERVTAGFEAVDTAPADKTKDLLVPVTDLLALQTEMQSALARLSSTLEHFVSDMVATEEKTSAINGRVQQLEDELETTRERLRITESLLPESAFDAVATLAAATAAIDTELARDKKAATDAPTPLGAAALAGAAAPPPLPPPPPLPGSPALPGLAAAPSVGVAPPVTGAAPPPLPPMSTPEPVSAPPATKAVTPAIPPPVARKVPAAPPVPAAKPGLLPRLPVGRAAAAAASGAGAVAGAAASGAGAAASGAGAGAGTAASGAGAGAGTAASGAGAAAGAGASGAAAGATPHMAAPGLPLPHAVAGAAAAMQKLLRGRKTHQQPLPEPEPELEPEPEEQPGLTFSINEVQVAQRYFNESEFVKKISEISRSIGKPKANVSRSLPGAAEAAITVFWDIVWYQYLVDLRKELPAGEERVILDREGMDLEELEPRFRDKNSTINDDGRLDASELEVRLLSDPSALITEMEVSSPEARLAEDATEEIWDQRSAPEFRWD